jgi:hypothetical protein
MQKKWKRVGASSERKISLTLSKETLRQLGDTELQAAAGGARGHIPVGGADSADCVTLDC